MINTLTLKLMSPAPGAPRFRDVPGARRAQTEGFGLVRRAAVPHAAANTVNDHSTPPEAHRDGGDEDLRTPMSRTQRDALHALIHARSPARGARWARRDRGIDFVWAGTLALLLALAASSIDSGRIFVATADRLHAVAEAKAAVKMAEARSAAAPTAAVARQSSPGTSRTM